MRQCRESGSSISSSRPHGKLSWTKHCQSRQRQFCDRMQQTWMKTLKRLQGSVSRAVDHDLRLVTACVCEPIGWVQEAQEAMRAALKPEQLAQFSIVGRDADFEETLGGKIPAAGIVSLKAGKQDAVSVQLYKKSDKNRKQKHDGSKGKPGGPKRRRTS